MAQNIGFPDCTKSSSALCIFALLTEPCAILGVADLFATLRYMKNEVNIPGMEELLTIKDVAELLKVSQVTVRRLQQGRHLPFFKVGGSVRFAKTDILEYLKKGRVEAIS